MKKRYAIFVLTVLLLVVPVTVLASSGTALERTMNAGWICDDIAGAMHCFDPGDGRSSNPATINVKVFDYDGTFEGTEQLWSPTIYSGQPCPQSELLNLGFAFACHHYSH